MVYDSKWTILRSQYIYKLRIPSSMKYPYYQTNHNQIWIYEHNIEKTCDLHKKIIDQTITTLFATI